MSSTGLERTKLGDIIIQADAVVGGEQKIECVCRTWIATPDANTEESRFRSPPFRVELLRYGEKGECQSEACEAYQAHALEKDVTVVENL